MKADRTKDARLIQYDAPGLRIDGAKAVQNLIVLFVVGIRGPRKNPVTERQIVDWFRGTSADFVRKQIDEVLYARRIRIVKKSLSSTRRYNGAYAYVPAEATQ